MSETNRELSRRDLLGGSALALAGMAAAACAPVNEPPGADPDAPGTPGVSDSWAETPERLFDNFVRVRCNREGGIAPWWWSGVYMAVTPDRNPKVLFAAEGCETKRFVRLDENRYEVWSK